MVLFSSVAEPELFVSVPAPAPGFIKFGAEADSSSERPAPGASLDKEQM
jgi:hypothetical protein